MVQEQNSVLQFILTHFAFDNAAINLRRHVGLEDMFGELFKAIKISLFTAAAYSTSQGLVSFDKSAIRDELAVDRSVSAHTLIIAEGLATLRTRDWPLATVHKHMVLHISHPEATYKANELVNAVHLLQMILYFAG